MSRPRSLSRRGLLRLGGATLGGGLAGCQSVGGQNQQTARATTETATTTTITAQTTRTSPPVITTQPESTPWWVRRLHSGAFDWNWPEGTPAATITVGTADTGDYRGLLVVNRDDQPVSVTVGISEQNETIHQADIRFASDAYLGIGLFVPADYRIQIRTAESAEALDIAESEFWCNDHWQLITIRSPTDIDSKHGQTLLKCETVSGESQ